MQFPIPLLPLSVEIETKEVLLQLNRANKALAELKGIAQTIPNEIILINTLILQEAKDSSAVENIVTSHDELYKAGMDVENNSVSVATKEVLDYAQALRFGFELIRKNRFLTLNNIIEIQQILEKNNAGFRKVPGTTLKNQFGTIIYTPPQDKTEIERLMENLELYINDNSICQLDPLLKMAIIHHQFESIHPFYDGNGRTGRIINILYLVMNELLDLPILYLSRYIISHKSIYYQLLQDVRVTNSWEQWILFMLKGIEEIALQTIELVRSIVSLMKEYKVLIRNILKKSYSHDLLNNLFSHPYTKIEHLTKALGVSRITATAYLEKLVKAGLIVKLKTGRTNYYLNVPLVDLLMNASK
ncbi:MAG: Fic family protein [Candidatus Kapabacteria bacterium]|nr:Fic family protein [Candidatus Kapabacteria bacterium]